MFYVAVVAAKLHVAILMLLCFEAQQHVVKKTFLVRSTGTSKTPSAVWQLPEYGFIIKMVIVGENN